MIKIFIIFALSINLWGGIETKYPSYKEIFSKYNIPLSFIRNRDFNNFVIKNEDRFRRNYLTMLEMNKDIIFPTLVKLSLFKGSEYLNIYIPIIESSLKINNKSHTGARGLWQFISLTGRESGFIMNRFVDQRNDPIISSINGFKYLDKMLKLTPNHKYLGIMAYNSGYGYMSRRASKNFDLGFLISNKSPIKEETKNYIQKFLLMAMIGENHRFIYDNEVEYIKNSSKGNFLIKVDLGAGILKDYYFVSNRYNVPIDVLKKYNKQFKVRNPRFRYINIPKSYLRS